MFEGVFPAIITPFKEDYSLDEEGLKRNIEYLEKSGIAGIVPCGTTGEAATLTFEEHKKVVEIAVDCSKVPVIAGTGSNVLGKDHSGGLHSAGGWGRILGDEGSGYDIGLRAIKSAVLEIDGRSGPTAIGRALRDRFGWSTRDQIIAAVYREQFPVATVAPVILELADAGDSTAVELLRSAAAPLADQARVVLQRLGPDPRAAFIGGLVSQRTSYTDVLSGALKALVPGLSITAATHTPVEGALMMALSRLTTPHAGHAQ